MKDIIERCRKLMLQSNSDYGAVLRSAQENNRERIVKTSFRFTQTCEKLAFSAREIASVYATGSHGVAIDSADADGDIVFPCELTDDGIFNIRLPMFSHRVRPQKTLLHPILAKTLALYFSEYDKVHGLHRRYERGTLAFIFSFASTEFGYDIDNINDVEYKKTSDDIISYFLPNDRAYRCSRFQMARQSDQTCVDTYFIPSGMFVDWIQKVKITGC